jgi:hypothetical protein
MVSRKTISEQASLFYHHLVQHLITKNGREWVMDTSHVQSLEFNNNYDTTPILFFLDNYMTNPVRFLYCKNESDHQHFVILFIDSFFNSWIPFLRPIVYRTGFQLKLYPHFTQFHLHSLDLGKILWEQVGIISNQCCNLRHCCIILVIFDGPIQG